MKTILWTFVGWISFIAGAPLAWSDDETPPAPPAPPADTRTFDLKYKFSPGEIIRTEVVHRATVQSTIQGTSQTAETQSKSVKRWQIDKVGEDGAVTFTHSVESIDMWQKMQGRSEIRYNSQTDSEVPPGYEEAAESVAIPLSIVTMNDRGKILKRFEKRPQPTSLSTQMTMPLPDRPIHIGDSWSTPMDIDVIMKDGGTKKIQTRQKFTLEKVASDVATIDVDTQILTPISDPALEAQLIQRLTTGSVRFDMAAGRVLNQQLDLDRNVIGFSGPSSSMHYVTRFTEQLLDEPAPVAATPAAPTSAAKAAPVKKAAPARR